MINYFKPPFIDDWVTQFNIPSPSWYLDNVLKSLHVCVGASVRVLMGEVDLR